MKKNKIMRFASLVLVLTLLSTCAISGTFAKYVTSDSASDTARVAKWGVVLSAANNSNFKDSYGYNTDETGVKGTLAVQADTEGTAVVAPGTADATGIDFTIYGTPEVATKVDIVMNVTKDIVVPMGTYTDYTKPTKSDGTYETFELEEAYTPVVFVLTQNGEVVKSGTLADIEEAIEGYAATAYYAPNTNLGAGFNLSWKWDFNGNDAADTLLGNIIAGTAAPIEGVVTSLAYDITFTVTQVD